MVSYSNPESDTVYVYLKHEHDKNDDVLLICHHKIEG
jgi:hypothetical protein